MNQIITITSNPLFRKVDEEMIPLLEIVLVVGDTAYQYGQLGTVDKFMKCSDVRFIVTKEQLVNLVKDLSERLAGMEDESK